MDEGPRGRGRDTRRPPTRRGRSPEQATKSKKTKKTHRSSSRRSRTSTLDIDNTDVEDQFAAMEKAAKAKAKGGKDADDQKTDYYFNLANVPEVINSIMRGPPSGPHYEVAGLFVETVDENQYTDARVAWAAANKKKFEDCKWFSSSGGKGQAPTRFMTTRKNRPPVTSLSKLKAAARFCRAVMGQDPDAEPRTIKPSQIADLLRRLPRSLRYVRADDPIEDKKRAANVRDVLRRRDYDFIVDEWDAKERREQASTETTLVVATPAPAPTLVRRLTVTETPDAPAETAIVPSSATPTTPTELALVEAARPNYLVMSAFVEQAKYEARSGGLTSFLRTSTLVGATGRNAAGVWEVPEETYAHLRLELAMADIGDAGRATVLGSFGDGRGPIVDAPPTDEGHGSESSAPSPGPSAVESAPTNAGPEAPICPFFVRGNCRYDSKCWKRHARVVVATKAQQGAAVCWNSGRGCKKGENCRFRHYAEPMSG